MKRDFDFFEKFVSRHRERQGLWLPFRVGDEVVATDGMVLVAVPVGDVCPMMELGSNPPKNVAELMAGAFGAACGVVPDSCEGFLLSALGISREKQTQACPECGCRIEPIQSFGLFGVSLDAGKLRKFMPLGGARIFEPLVNEPTECSPYRIFFDGGRGLLMPVRTPGDDAEG